MRDAFLNGGSNSRSARGSGNNTATAAGAGDATEVNGAWQSRLTDKGMALSAKLVVSFIATLAQGATLKFGANFQDALTVGGSGAADFGDVVAAQTVATGGTGGSTETGTFELDINLSGAREFIRAQVTPDLSAANTDTTAWHMDYVFYGTHRDPLTKSPLNLGSVDAL